MSTTAEGLAPWVDLYPAGVTPELVAGAATMLEAWDRTVARVGTDAPAIHYFDRTVTVGEVEDQSDRLAAGLGDLGVGAGDRIAVYLQNDPHWMVATLAAWKCGATIVAVNPMNRQKELRFILEDSGARVLVCLAGLLPVVDDVAADISLDAVVVASPGDFAPGPLGEPVVGGVADWDGTPIATARTIAWADLLRSAPLETRAALDGDSVGLLTYTSGTTGRPKGAMNLHRCLTHSSQVYTQWFDLDDDDVVLGVAPLFHITGAVAGMCLTLMTGAPLVLLHRFDAEVTLRAIALHRATFTVAASTAFIALINADGAAALDVSSLTKVASGGAPVSPALVQRIRDRVGWEIHGVYGMTETTSPTHLAPLDRDAPVDPRSGALAVGVPVPGLEIRLADVVTGEPVADDQEGEIVVRGPMVVPGYWRAEEETAYAVRDGWLYTGDIGVMDRDGWLFVVDRKKDLINAGGYKVWPREVEDVLYQHPAVREAAVVGVPDDYRGETVKAFVSLAPGGSVTEDELIGFTKERMAAYKRPTQVEIVPEIPKNASGKILRRELRTPGADG